MEFSGKAALVTGAASGIGAAVTRLLVRDGARVFAADRAKAPLEALAAELGPAVTPHVVELEDAAQIEAMVAAAVRTLGGLDILINNAGIGSLARATDLSPEEWRRVMTVDLDAVFLISRAALPALIERRGNIVCTASISGIGGDYRFTVYNAAKAGLIGLVKALAVDYAADGVRVNAVSPGYTATPMTAPSHPDVKAAFIGAIPMRRAGTPEEMAQAMAFLASDRASYVTGHNLVVDGGLTAHTGQPDVYTLNAELRRNAQAAS